jgi:PAS domain S-box-containing protein
LSQLLHSTLIVTDTGEKSLVIFLDGRLIVLKGGWEWELASDLVFCSDVILSDYRSLEGTRAIIHPEDLAHLKQHLRFLQETGISTFGFRIITTYGEVKTLRGENVVIHDPGSTAQLRLTEELLAKEAAAKEAAREVELMSFARKSFELSEEVTKTGTWYANTSTNEIVYSDELYRIYGLPPQSRNPHLNTFSSFTHIEDAALVAESFDRAYKAQLPLHLEFRIVTAEGKERTVRQIIQWQMNDRGENVLYGITKDITDEKSTEHALEKNRALLEFSNQLEKFHDQVTNTGHWLVDLLTRNTVYSDNYYRLFGLKPQVLQGKMVRFIDYVYHEDRELFEDSLRTMHYEHKPPNIEFRIIRTDGKVRLIKQSARIEIYGDSEMVMIGIIEDVTQKHELERKARELDERTTVQHFAYERAEEVTKTGTLTLDLQTNITTWSANLFRLLGYKPNMIEPATNQILKYIHPNDRKRFNDEIELALNNNGGQEFMMQFYRMGEVRYFQASFKITVFGQKRFLVGIFRDITDEYERELVSAEKIQLVDLLTQNILDRVMITDQSNNIVFWNRQCEQVFNLKAEQVLRKNLFEVMPVLKHEVVLGDFKEALKGKAIHHYHVQDIATKRYIDLHMLPLRNEHNEVTGLLHVLHDVTEQYELKQNLTERLSFIENILETTVDRIKVFDRHMNFVYWNSRAEAFYGLKKEDVIGRNILEIFPGFQNNAIYFQFRQALRGQTVYISPEQAINEGCYYQTYLIPIKNDAGEVTSVLWVTHDFSKEYKLLENQRKAYSILDTIEEACYELDTAGKILFVNRKAEILWKKSREDLLNNTIWQVFPQAVDSALYFAINHAIDSKELVQQEIFSPILNRKVFINITPTATGVIVAYVDLHERPAGTGIRETKE